MKRESIKKGRRKISWSTRERILCHFSLLYIHTSPLFQRWIDEERKMSTMVILVEWNFPSSVPFFSCPISTVGWRKRKRREVEATQRNRKKNRNSYRQVWFIHIRVDRRYSSGHIECILSCPLLERDIFKVIWIIPIAYRKYSINKLKMVRKRLLIKWPSEFLIVFFSSVRTVVMPMEVLMIEMIRLE
jgi:hypothetical protein